MPVVFLLVGPSSKQKTNYAKAGFFDCVYINPRDYKTKEAEKNALFLAKVSGFDVVIDGENASINDRRFYIDFFKRNIAIKYNYRIDCRICSNSTPFSGDPNIVFHNSYKKSYQTPYLSEGMGMISCVDVLRYSPENYNNKALFFDLISTCNVCGVVDRPDHKIYPKNLVVKKFAKKQLKLYKSIGFRLIGVTNQERVKSGAMTEREDHECIVKIISDLGVALDDVLCCPLQSVYQKPSPNFAFKAQSKFKLDLGKCIVVGYSKPDKIFCKRAGINVFIEAREFFDEYKQNLNYRQIGGK